MLMLCRVEGCHQQQHLHQQPQQQHQQRQIQQQQQQHRHRVRPQHHQQLTHQLLNRTFLLVRNPRGGQKELMMRQHQ